MNNNYKANENENNLSTSVDRLKNTHSREISTNSNKEINEKKNITKFKNGELLKDKIENKEFPLEINWSKQKRHLLNQGETSKADGRSYMIITKFDIQKIIYEKHLTGTILHKNNQFKEIIQCDYDIGFDARSNSITNRATIHYSKTGTHIVPSRRRDN